jgi:energy-coupling factor transporter ATP-binding protein EcfA2
MRLTKFRVTNFRSVVDSDWIEADQVTALIGVNESGKTNLLLPLWKLNPAREGEIKPTSDYPKANYAAVRANPEAFDFITAEFDISELADKIAGMTGVDSSAFATVHVTRYFDGRHVIKFPAYKARDSVSAADLSQIIKTARDEISDIPPIDDEKPLQLSFLEAARDALEEIGTIDYHSADSINEIAAQLSLRIPDTAADTSSVIPRYRRLIEDLTSFETRLRAPAPAETSDVKDLIVESIPRFVYYSNYGNLDSEIYLPHVVHNLKRDNLGAREAAKARTLRVLFTFVQLEPAEILELGRDFRDPQRQPRQEEIDAIATKKRERTILLHSAGADLTKRFRDWWKQGDYIFDFNADGDHFRIWVSDSNRPEKVELEDRSSGLQWFLSFYLIFLVESNRDHRDSILLLDEPGLSLHPLAQRDLSEFFENLATTNQLLYTTHSPFLVDADMLDRVRKVYVGPDGSTKASADLRRGNEDPRKSGATYAIYSALNMNVAESLLYGCHPAIVEGPSDQHYLSIIKTILIGSGRINPKRELVFPPSHGANNAKVVASILTGRDSVLPIMLLDGDDAGQKMARDMQNALYQNAKERILTTNKYSGLANSETEDLFPPLFISDVVDRLYRNADIPFTDVLKRGAPIVPQIRDWAKSQEVTLEDGWKVGVARHAKRRALAPNASEFDKDTLDRWTTLFNDLLAPD